MALKDTVKQWFKTKLKPTQAQFYTFFDSIRWKEEKIATSDVDGLDNLLTTKADKAPFDVHLADTTKHVTAQEKANWNEVTANNTGDETLVSLQDKRPLKTVQGESIEGNGNITIQSEIAITDHLDSEKFKVTDKLKFGEGFEFDPITKEVQIKGDAFDGDEINVPINNGEFNFKVKKLGGDSGIYNDYREKVILLIPFEDRDVSSNNKINGKLTLSRNGGNEWSTIDVAGQSVYNISKVTMFSSGDSTGHKLVTFNYNGVKWIGVKIEYKANPYNNYWFNGQHVSNDLDVNNDALTVQQYFNTQTDVITNSEIYNSIEYFISYGELKTEFNDKVFAPNLISNDTDTYGSKITNIVKLTQALYDALDTKDDNTLYFVI